MRLLPLLLIAWFVYLCGCCVASSYFDFTLAEQRAFEDSTVDITLVYNLKNVEPKIFRVRPISSTGSVQIFNSARGEWLGEYGLWSAYPELNVSHRLKIKFNGSPKITLAFEIGDSVTGEVYRTPTRTLWNKEVSVNYITALNENVSESSSALPDVEPLQVSNPWFWQLCDKIFQWVRSKGGFLR